VAATMDRLTDSPSEQGWPWELALLGEGGYGALPTDDLDNRFASFPEIRSWSYLGFEDVSIRGQEVPAQAVRTVTGRPGLVVTEGRPPRDPDDVALGGATMDDLGLDVGDVVAVRGNGAARTFQLVGRAVLPSIGRGDGPRAGLGTGAVFTFGALSSLRDEPIVPTAALLEVTEERAPDVAEQLVRQFQAAEGGPLVLAPQLSGQLRAWNTMRWVPVAVAALIAAMAIASLVHALSTTIHRGGGDLAVVRALGVTARQVRDGVRIQALVLLGFAVVVGGILGSIAGRVGWEALQQELGVPRTAVVPGLALTASVFGGLVLALAASWGPARQATRRLPAAALRSP